MTQKICLYQSIDGYCCDDLADNGEFCYWHNDQIIKNDKNLIEKLEQRALTGKPMRGFSLRKANLQGINLVNAGSKQGFDMRDCDLYRADLSQAHLFGLQLQGSSLMKANFTGSNLHKANITGCNLLGIKLNDAKLEYLEWGDQLIQEQQAKTAESRKNIELRQDLYQQAEEIYRKLRLETERQGMPDVAGIFFQREMKVRRKQCPVWSLERFISLVVDLFCGYGEKPLRVIGFSMSMIGLSAIAYFLSGLKHGEAIIGFTLQQGISENLYDLLECLYFSVITFTTLGYGDIVPTDIARLIAAVEAFCGSFTLALFVVVFVKKMTR
ncbi:MAG: pentapeptide repeat-containing protein [Pseudomonadales bacterium]|nr:pentapeptide repeat-containing protein [Pseudomonadales bacterium]